MVVALTQPTATNANTAIFKIFLFIFFMYLVVIYILLNQRLLVLQVVTKEEANKLWVTIVINTTIALQQQKLP